MKIILAPDKYKGSLTGIEFCNTVEKGLKSLITNAEIIKLPLADGGDGTIEILGFHLEANHIKLKVNDPLFRPIEASYLFITQTKTAFIEMAEASGMKLLSSNDQNCMNTTTYGTGELILDAIKRGAKTIILGLGGSATNDCGIGMATALGYKFLDSKNKEIIPVGKNMCKIKTIETSKVNSTLKEITFKVACDVKNPLYGQNGAAFIYAQQKGASQNEIIYLNKGLEHIARIFQKEFNIDIQNIEGAGAAGGMGAGSIIFLNARLISGIDLIKEIINFDKKIKEADWIITGEGKLDSQTLSGKTIQGVLTSAKNYNIRVAALCGAILLSEKSLKSLGFSYTASIMDKAIDVEDAMLNSSKYLYEISSQFAKFINDTTI
ncbi:glycerate kinase [Lutibacter sp.]|uniref:glycerate kinase n=1 Tax=Lutibacter sp. TaxID=1925666 RepID=UPI0025C537D9|nr:glycerate kinase [Lutibacter sp.]MCF6167234.1 glycerate kinase [Lutibacter sp.]